MTDDFEIPLPYSEEAEQATLGACLIDAGAWVNTKDDLTVDAFYVAKHRTIWKAMNRAAKDGVEGGVVDIITVTKALQDMGDLAEIGGTQYLASLADAVPTASNVDFYAGIVLQKYQEREFITTQREAAIAVESGADVNDIIAKQQQKLVEIQGGKRNKNMTPIGDVLLTAFESIEQRSARAYEASKTGEQVVVGIPSNYPDLDKMTSGFRKSDLIILAARPAVGKTAFALNVAQNVAINSRETVAIFSLEMGKEQLVERMLCAEANIDAGRLRSGMLEEEDWPKLVIAVGKLEAAPIFIDDTAGTDVYDIRAKCRKLKAQHGLGLVLIDYLQLISGSGKRGNAGNRQQEVSEISRTLKLIARELDVPVIALSQLSRSVEQRADKRPMMSDLRESGSIEQDADIVAFLYRDDYYNPESDRKNIIEIIIAKQRSGPTGTVELVFLKNFNKFVSLERAPGA